MLPDDELWLVNVLTEAAEGPQQAGPVLAVVGGRGGAGASVFAAAVAVAAVRDGERALLVDCDPLGGGLDLLLAAEDVAGLRWADISVGRRAGARGRVACGPAVSGDRRSRGR